MTWLVSDWDHRDPNSDLEDIETGKCLEAIDSVGQLTRMLIESTDFHPTIEEDSDGHCHIVKLIRKRNSEFKQGRETHFVYDKEGTRINLSEEQFDSLLGINHNPDDVFNTEDIDLETLDSSYTAPRDDWDVVWDETEVRRAHKQLQTREFWDSWTEEQKDEELQLLRDGEHPDYEGVKEYSSSYFPYPADRRMVSPKSMLIASQIRETGITRGRLARLLSEPPKHDLRPEKSKALKEQALKLPLGKERARLLGQAQAMMACYTKSMKAMRKRGQTPVVGHSISATDKKALWAMWKDQQVATTGSCELTQWQYEKALYAKLVRTGVDVKDARHRVRLAVKKLYNSNRIGRLVSYESAKHQQEANAEWLQKLQPVSETVTEDDNWQPQEWLPSHAEISNEIPSEE